MTIIGYRGKNRDNLHYSDKLVLLVLPATSCACSVPGNPGNIALVMKITLRPILREKQYLSVIIVMPEGALLDLIGDLGE